MKIRITKEKDNFVAQILGVKDGIYAQGKTAEEALDFLVDVYQNVMDTRKEMNLKKIQKTSLDKKIPGLVKGLSFKKLELSI